jgi:hypothetical protein
MSAEQDEMWLELPTGMEHVTRFNTELWRYIGQSATLGDHSVFNHVRITSTDEETGEEEGMAIVFADNENFDNLSRFMLRWNYPQHFNLCRVTPFVQYAFDATHGIDENETTFP